MRRYIITYVRATGAVRLTYRKHPHMTPDETWKNLFVPTAAAKTSPDEEIATDELVAAKLRSNHALFTPSSRPAVEEILRLLRENEADTITIVAIGPLTNMAHAASIDPEAFLRAKEVVVMGGTVHEHGNVGSPVDEMLSPVIEETWGAPLAKYAERIEPDYARCGIQHVC